MIPFEQQIYFLENARQGPGFIGYKSPPNGTFIQKWFSSNVEALEIIETQYDNSNIWISMAEFPDPDKARNKEAASYLLTTWLDIDAHKDSKYKTRKECLIALQSFVKETNLPKPQLIHDTGHGIQALWVFSKKVDVQKWLSIAGPLQKLAELYDLGADPITKDPARILRVPGTQNFRDPEKTRQAKLFITSTEKIELGDFSTALTDALALAPLKEKTQSINVKEPLPDTSENSEILRFMLAKIDPDILHPDWRNIIWAAHATGLSTAYEIAKTWSQNGEKWDEQDFEQMWSSFNSELENSIGLGTLVFHAQQAGYSGPTFDKTDIPKANCPSIHTLFGNIKKNTGLVTKLASDIEPQPIEWLVEGVFPLGMMAVIGGQPGMGKSQISLKLAAAVTTGNGLPDGKLNTITGNVIILANEDDSARTIRPRLDAAGADISKIHIVEGVAREKLNTDIFQLDTDIVHLSEKVKDIGNVRLIIIDPPTAYLGSKVDAYKESDVRRILAPLSQLANDTGALVLLVVHLNKRSDGGAQQRFGGSTAWIAAPRAAFLVGEDKTTQERYMLPVKNNLGNDKLGFRYHILEKLLEYPCGFIKAPYVEWLGYTEQSADALLNSASSKTSSALDEAKDFLQQELADGPKLSKEVIAVAKEVGISIATLNRAKSELLISSSKSGSTWKWKLLGGNDDE